jgi:hypothetical protein
MCLEEISVKFPEIDKCQLFPSDEVTFNYEGNAKNQGYNRQEACYYYYAVEEGMFGTNPEGILNSCKDYLPDNSKLLLDCKIAVAISDSRSGDYESPSLFYSSDNDFLCEQIPFEQINRRTEVGTYLNYESYYFGPRYAFIGKMSPPHWFWAGHEYTKFGCYADALQRELCGKIEHPEGQNVITEKSTNCQSEIIRIAREIDNLQNLNILEFPNDLKIYSVKFCDFLDTKYQEECRKIYS